MTSRMPRVEICAPRDESHVLAGMREPRTQVAADGAHANDRYLQLHSSTARKECARL
jgi:hypothetical protein